MMKLGFYLMQVQEELLTREWVLYVWLGLSIALSGFFFIRVYRSIFRVEDDDGERETEMTSPWLKLMLPYARAAGSAIDRISPYVESEDGSVLGKGFLVKYRWNLKKQLTAAGTPEGLRVNEFIGLMFVGAVLGGAFGALFGIMTNSMMEVGPNEAGYVPIGLFFTSILGFFMPRIWLRDHANRRRFSIQKTLPFSLDLLTLCVEAGLDFTAALDRIMDKLKGLPLGYEFANLLHEVRMGKPRVRALRDLANRVQLDDMTSCMSALIQADELGVSLGPILRIQADQMRTKRAQRAEKLAMEAPVKILFPLVCFIFPTTFIILLGPIVLKYFLGGG